MFLRERLQKFQGELGRRGSVRGKIFVQDEDVHASFPKNLK
jgi:hypothetical protein